MQQTKNLGPRRLRTEQETSDRNSQPTGVTHEEGWGKFYATQMPSMTTLASKQIWLSEGAADCRA
jgi:hypothetical protein